MSPRPAHADPFEALSHPVRRRLLELLEGGERPVGELAREFKFSAPALSQQLGVLKKAGLVAERREGRRRLYRLTPEPLAEVQAWVEARKDFWTVKLAALGRHLRKTHEDRP